MIAFLTGLRGRLVITFTVVAVTASALVAGIGFELAKGALIERTTKTAVDDLTKDLERIDFAVGELRPGEVPPSSEELTNLANALAGPDRHTLLEYQDQYYRDDEGLFGGGDVTGELRGQARSRLASQRRMIDGELWLVLGTQVYRAGTDDVAQPTGLLVFEFVSLSEEERTLANLREAFAQAGGITLLIALTVALVSARHVLLPVGRLSAAAQALGRGRLDTRLPVRGKDELAELTAHFNDAAAALELSVSELRALEAMSRRFVADVSHELRTPLTAMTAVADMLSEEAERLPEQPAKAVRLVLSEVGRLRELVEHLIEVSRFDAGTATLALESVDVADAICDSLEVRGWSDDVRVQTPAGVVANLDPRRFDVIVANLVGNALKHGGQPVLITARSTPNGLEVKVRDHGEGIPPEALPHVFDRFFKVGTGRVRSQGSGLGLSIARANAQLHGGTISVRPQQPGTLFTVWLPHT
ncbi:HAMP domain-containing sensor histidine kinase [Nonomuraea roseola]|uniref:histidine kinase n=1 Tax=Nonomuraea roseola TaxID=46179 RepID=A0ABV5Q0L0_9ACTN